ncbi:DUF5979 domain-containing protein [Cellulomonas edaphi]|uniref:DUF5979 domain-containing protein n=1 Tax=Cellulomonas edaphi TaxID=3053468 RepID=A0ABT7S402_9CELL|nr:DUF5979 domain-containing protein [Cellulomons edaphi]MDM7830355.1 DUF5979 domain-containing protein [Cellulomons edaphi]
MHLNVIRPARRAVSGVTVAALLATGLVAGASTASAATDTVGGRVYRDFNGNGAYDTVVAVGVAKDVGLPGVDVVVTDGRGASTTVQTGPTGQWTADVTSLTGPRFRVQLETPDALVTSAVGSANRSSVQFVEAGATDVDYGVNVPADHTQDHVPLVTTIQYAGTRAGADVKDLAAVTATPWDVARNDSGANDYSRFAARTTIATYGQVGSVWSTAYSGVTDDLYVSATYKRHADLGPGGLGAIYRFADLTADDGTVRTTPAMSTIDVTTLRDQDGNLIDVGTAARPALGSSSSLAPDADAFAKAAKVGIGGISLNARGTVLYFVNLRDAQLYAVDLTATPRTALRVGSGAGAGEQPWALSVRGGKVYVGSTDTGAVAGQPAGTAGLRAHVRVASEAAVLAGSPVWTSVVKNGDGTDGVALGYTKGNPISGWSGRGTYWADTKPQVKRWNTWSDTWTFAGGAVGFAAPDASGAAGWGPVHAYPQAVLTDLTFDQDGFLILSLADRTAIQGGNRNSASDPAVTGTFESVSAGDMLIAGATDVAHTQFRAESNGSVTGYNYLGASVVRSGQVGNGQGPGGGEFYADQQNLGTGATHYETTLGSAVSFPGAPQPVLATVFDPLGGIRLAGLMWFNGTTGAAVRGYEHTLDTAQTSGSRTFQKGGGLGAIEALAGEAPVEIGNRVWFDADQDGIQDADEPAVAGVVVGLVDQGGTTVATRTTDASGEYYFRSDTDGFDAFGAYTLTFTRPSTGSWSGGAFGDVPWSRLSFTTQDAGSDDTVDSDADTTGTLTYTVRGPGENDHTLDVGLVADASFTVEKAISPDGGTADPGATFAMHVQATSFRGEPLSLPAGDTDFDVSVGSGNGHTVSVPLGTRVEVTETTTTGLRSPATVDPAGSFAVLSTGQPQLVTVTNTLVEPGTFSVHKSVTGPGAAYVPAGTGFTVEYSTDAGSTWKTLTVADGATVTSPELPAGSTVLVREAPRPAVTGVVWGAATWTIGSATSTGTQSVTIGDGTDIGLALENPTTLVSSGFSVTKDVAGAAAGSVPDDFAFTVHYAYVDAAGADVTGDLELSKSAPTDGVAGVPFGTSVTLSESTPTGAPADVRWGAPGWAGTGVTDNGDGSATLVVGASTAAVTLTNPTTQRTGGFDITKRVTGAASGSAPDADYTVHYAYGTTSGTLSMAADETDGVTGIPAGTEVLLWEGTRPAGAPDLSWGTPVWGGAGVTDNGDGTATLVVGDGVVADVELTNPTTQLVGGFSVTKAVTGDASASVPPTFQFTVRYALDGVDQPPITLTTADPTRAFAGLPRGAVVTLDEVSPTGAPADVRWGNPVWSGTGVTVQGDGSASFVVGDQAVAVTLTNPTARVLGSFAVTKRVVGEGRRVLEGDPAFSVTYSHPGAQPETITVHDGERWASPQLPAGTVVTLSEARPLVGLPAGATWGTPRFLVGGVEVDSVTIGDGTTVEVTLENPTAVTPLVDIEKGDGVGSTITHDADTMADGEVYAPGERRRVVLTVANTGTERLRDVVLRDSTVSGADVTAIRWTFPDGSTALADRVSGAWEARWEATFDGSTSFAPGAVITGIATLTVRAGDAPHVDRARVDAVGVASGTRVDDRDDYHAFTGAIQVIKYDGSHADPVVRDGGDWVIPAKPLVDPAQDANDAAHAVHLPAGAPSPVRWVVTNTGSTTLTDVDLVDVTRDGPALTGITCDLSELGGPATFAPSRGTWHGLLPPSASFFCTGTLTLATGAHADTVTATATVVVPAVDAGGVPTGAPSLGGRGRPVVATHDDGTPVRVTDADPFHAVDVVEPTERPGVDPTEPTPGGPAPKPVPDDESLARTGSDVAPALGVALLAVLLGGLAVGVARRRRS